jgi:hypothetical protein
VLLPVFRPMNALFQPGLGVSDSGCRDSVDAWQWFRAVGRCGLGSESTLRTLGCAGLVKCS